MSFLQIAVTATSPSAVKFFLFALGFVLLIGWLMRGGTRIASERATALAQVAAGQGLQFSGQGRLEVPGARAHLFMPYERRGKCRNFLTGQFNHISAQFFDYTQLRGGSTGLVDLVAVSVFRFEGAALPDFHLVGRNVGDSSAPAAIRHWATKQHGLKTDIPLDVISAAASGQTRSLASRYLLLGDDADAVRAWFTPARVSLIESVDADFYPWIIHASGPWILLGHRGGHASPNEYPGFIEHTRALAEGLAIHAALEK